MGIWPLAGRHVGVTSINGYKHQFKEMDMKRKKHILTDFTILGTFLGSPCFENRDQDPCLTK